MTKPEKAKILRSYKAELAELTKLQAHNLMQSVRSTFLSERVRVLTYETSKGRKSFYDRS